ncbi:factor-independent urate hydroxylase [Dactylosporangium sucinum]|uniref:Uricase n=1 Tax=Dactylosporangium sucinum TaxID=1424081 RepID=A0A917WJ06_9ACTN|nr:urate oxidase [Dactylosporangium sucinum]GGM07786.1 uricase [Dactylosporangium sucinum]
MLGSNQYGKAEIRIVRVDRRPGGDELTDLNVSVALRGDLAASHLTGDNSNVLPTDTQKNTVYAFARQHGIDSIESFAQRLAEHFVASQESIREARVSIEQYLWRKVDGNHTFERTAETRTATVHHGPHGTQTVSGVRDLVLLKTTDSEFHGFVKDRYTTLPETADRILATSVNATWRHDGADPGAAKRALVEAFADTHSLALQQTLYGMGSRVLERCPEVVEVKLSLPNKHHFLVDLTPFGLDNPNEVYYAADRPYGLIEGVVRRDGVEVPEEVVWSF